MILSYVKRTIREHEATGSTPAQVVALLEKNARELGIDVLNPMINPPLKKVQCM